MVRLALALKVAECVEVGDTEVLRRGVRVGVKVEAPVALMLGEGVEEPVMVGVAEALEEGVVLGLRGTVAEAPMVREGLVDRLVVMEVEKEGEALVLVQLEAVGVGVPSMLGVA